MFNVHCFHAFIRKNNLERIPKEGQTQGLTLRSCVLSNTESLLAGVVFSTHSIR